MVVNGLIVVPQVMWLKNGTSVVGGNGTTLTSGMVSSNTTALALQFNPLRTSNGGQYTCIANVSLPSISITSLSTTSSASVIVQIPKPIINITAAALSQVIAIGSNITLTCSIQLDPSVDSTVTVNGTWTGPAGTAISGSAPVKNGSIYQTTLSLISLKTTDVGIYTCSMTVSAAAPQFITQTTVSETIQVSAQAVNITSSGSPVAGQVYTLTCTGSLVGNASIVSTTMWRNASGGIPSGYDITVSGGTLTFNPLRTSHGGQYICLSMLTYPFNSTATNTTNVIVQIPPPTVTITSTPITTSYYAGTPLNLTCNVQLLPQVDTNVAFNYLWTGPTGQISSAVGRVSLSSGVNQTSVQFYPLNTTDTGVYNCSVSVSASGQLYVDTSIAVSSSVTSITVKGLPAPQVSITPSGSSTAGSPYTLTCTVMVVNGLIVVPQVMWLKNSLTVLIGSGVSEIESVKSNVTTSVLRFNSLYTSNGGQYSCVATLSLSVISIRNLSSYSLANVTVTIPPPIVVTMATPSQVVTEEDNVTLTCNIQLDHTVDSNVTVNISWIEPGGTTLNPTSPAQIGSTYSCIVRLPSVVIEESGVYTCVVSLSAEYITTVNASSAIEVAIFATSIVASSNATFAGMNLTLTCIVDTYRSSALPSVMWIGPTGTITNTSDITINDQQSVDHVNRNVSLMFSSLHTSHGGRYTCVSMVTTPAVANLMVSKDVIIQIPPPTVTITSTPITTSHYAGTPLNLTCNVQLIPQVDTEVTVIWHKGLSIITIDNYTTVSQMIKFGSSSYVTTLMFNPLGTADSGRYSCNVSVQSGAPYVTSGVGGASLSLQVLDLPAPNVTITPSLPLPSLGASYSLTCRAMEVAGLALPVSLTWTRADGLSLGTIPVTNISISTLTFPSWSVQNLAEYNCIANISLPYKGIMITAIASVVLKAPGVVSGPAVSTLSDSSSVISWSTPQLTYGHLTGYVLSIVQLMDYGVPVSGTTTNISVDITVTSYTWSGLYPGVPYQTCINAVNTLGPGDPWCNVFFTREEIPSVAPSGVLVTRSSDGVSMNISWSPLTLSQARGFVDYYIITYGPVADTTKRQQLTATTTGAYAVVLGLNPMLKYSVTVNGHTSVGLGPSSISVISSVPIGGLGPSTSVTSSPPPVSTSTSEGSLLIGPIAGALIGVILSVFVVIAVILILILRSKRHGKLFIGRDKDRVDIGMKAQNLELTSINVTENVCYERTQNLELTSINVTENVCYERTHLPENHAIYETINDRAAGQRKPHLPNPNEVVIDVGTSTALYHNLPPSVPTFNPFNTSLSPSSPVLPPPSLIPTPLSPPSLPPSSPPSTLPHSTHFPLFPSHQPSLPIYVSSFHDHVLNMHMNRDKRFEIEYHQLSEVKPEGHLQTVASLECNVRKNRFGNILPWDDNRVKLKEIPEVPGSDYINASLIEGKNQGCSYIASQGPKENTVSDFWRMVWEKRIEDIVMVTKCTEAGKSMCKQYWADEEGGVYSTDTLTVTTTSSITLADYQIRIFQVKTKTKENSHVLTVTHYQYTSWPDDGVLHFSTSFLSFMRRVQKTHDKSKGVPLLVHCSAGVGRTGVFIVLDTLLDQMRSEESISVFEVVKEMRKRRVLMIQTQAQYMFIHDALDEYLTCGDTGINVTNLRICINSLSKIKPGRTINGFQEQFSLLDVVSRKPTPGERSDGEQPYNIAKNRYQNKLPYNAGRPLLRRNVTEGSDYINASFVDSYKQSNAYIATQGPLQNTADDFWRMVWEFKCRVIVMLCPLTEEGHESSYCYWPTEEGITVAYGCISVTLQSQLLYEGYEVRTFNIRDKSKEQDTVVTQLHYTEWPEHGRPPNTTSVVEMMDTLTRTQISTGNKPIVVHCNDGVGRTGTFITIYSELERLKTEGIVDVFQRVKLSRIARPGLVQNVIQYIYCHEFLAEFNSNA